MSTKLKLHKELVRLYDLSSQITLQYCISCNKCCKNNIFLCRFEIDNVSKIVKKLYYNKIDDNYYLSISPICKYLNPDGSCSIYTYRPLVCRLYPFMLLYINKRLHWAIHKKCPYHTYFVKYFKYQIIKIIHLINESSCKKYIINELEKISKSIPHEFLKTQWNIYTV